MYYKIFMLVALPAVVIGWIAYAMWIRKVREEEKNRPRPESKRLTQTKSEVSDWAKKMAQFEKPTHKPPDQNNKQ